MKKRTYRKINKVYWNGEHYFDKIGIAIILFIFFSFLHFNIQKFVNREPLISPVVAMEKSPSVVISCEDPIGYIRCKYYSKELTEQEAITLLAIGQAESLCNTKTNKNCIPNNGKEGIGVDPKAKNPHSSARGWFQIIAGTWYSNDCVGDKYNFKDNANCAIKIMKSSGYYPWEVYNTGSYKKYLNKFEI